MLASALVAYLLGPGCGFTFALLLGPAYGVVFALLVTGRCAELEARTHARLDPWVDRVVSRGVEPLAARARWASRGLARWARARLPATWRRLPTVRPIDPDVRVALELRLETIP